MRSPKVNPVDAGGECIEPERHCKDRTKLIYASVSSSSPKLKTLLQRPRTTGARANRSSASGGSSNPTAEVAHKRWRVGACQHCICRRCKASLFLARALNAQ